jgi:hypothetical protein
VLRWTTIDGAHLLSERRDVSCDLLDSGAWALTFAFTLTNATAGDLVIRSPAAHGRTGAGYGGFFWRAPRVPRAPQAPQAPRAPQALRASRASSGGGSFRVAAGSGDRVEVVHGSRSPWVSLICPQWTLVFVAATPRTREDPWFVRTRDYLGVGSALAWDQPLTLRPGADLTRRIVTVVADGALTPERAAAYAATIGDGPDA